MIFFFFGFGKRLKILSVFKSLSIFLFENKFTLNKLTERWLGGRKEVPPLSKRRFLTCYRFSSLRSGSTLGKWWVNCIIIVPSQTVPDNSRLKNCFVVFVRRGINVFNLISCWANKFHSKFYWRFTFILKEK